MYRAYFKLNESPFAITPAPHFLYLSESHREGLTHLLYGMGEAGGFVQLTGEVGTGKTTLYRSVLEHTPEHVDVALIINPKQSAAELIASICDELHVVYPYGSHSIKALNQHLLRSHAKGRRTVLIIDEAQDLDVDVLEQIRLLTNLETSTQKLLQIILVGQPELRNMLARPDLRQLAQRITARCHLNPLTKRETIEYIKHRLSVAGAEQPLFTNAAMSVIYRLSGGIPRLINNICDRALTAAYAEQKGKVTAPLAVKAAAEVTGEHLTPWRAMLPAWIPAASAAMVAVGLVGFLLFGSLRPEPTTVEANTPVIAPVARTVVTPPPPLPETEISSEKPINFSELEQSAFLEQLFAGKIQADTDTAFATLFDYWGIEFEKLPGGSTACARAEAEGFSCLFGRGTWSTLKLYNHPAIIELIGSEGRRYHLTLVHLDDEEAMFDIDGDLRSIAREKVEPLWFGAYIIAWRPPPIQASSLRTGDNGADVRWLSTQLARAEGKTDSNESIDTFDASLAERVKTFQRDHGLPPDGVVGQQTLVVLSGVTSDVAAPVLSGPIE